MKTRHNNKFNRKHTHVERTKAKITTKWMIAYQECILDSKKEVWILPVNTRNQLDLISF